MDGQVRLRPVTLLPQLANSLAQADTNIGCHQAIMAVFFRLHFAYRIHAGYPAMLGPPVLMLVNGAAGDCEGADQNFSDGVFVFGARSKCGL